MTSPNIGSVDLAAIRVGDEIAVRARAVKNPRDNGDLWFEVTYENGPDRWHHFQGPIHPDNIVSHTPKALCVGDRVRPFSHPEWRGTVLATDQDEAWVRWHDTLSSPWRFSDLERLP